MRTPLVAIVLVASYFGESLSGSTPPLDLILPWNLALVAGLYGSGALICREVARRCRLGFLGLCILGAAYGVYEEAFVDGYWFYPKYWHDAGIGSYSEVWHTNLLLAVHLTAFHTAVSVGASVLIVERLFPSFREKAWVGRRGLAVAAFVFAVLVPIAYSDAAPRGQTPVLVATGGLLLALVGLAFLSRRLPRRARPRPAYGRPRLVFTTAFACAAVHFLSVYAMPSTGIPWPVGIAITIVPLVVGGAVVRRTAVGDLYERDGLRVVTGVLAFFLVLDFFVGLGGRVDLTLAAIATAFALRRLGRDTGLNATDAPAPV